MIHSPRKLRDRRALDHLTRDRCLEHVISTVNLVRRVSLVRSCYHFVRSMQASFRLKTERLARSNFGD